MALARPAKDSFRQTRTKALILRLHSRRRLLLSFYFLFCGVGFDGALRLSLDVWMHSTYGVEAF